MELFDFNLDRENLDEPKTGQVAFLGFLYGFSFLKLFRPLKRTDKNVLLPIQTI